MVLLFLLAIAMPISFAIWTALLNNFVIQISNFSGVEIGWLQTIREIPGFLAVGVLILLIFLREQNLAILSLFALGLATAATGFFPSFSGLLVTTLIGSFGFHYFETVNQSLQLQWLSKDQAPKVLGWLMAAGSAVTFAAYGVIVLTWETLGLGYNLVYLVSGGLTVLIALFCLLAYPQFQAPTRQHTKIVLRRRYWLYYCLQFTAGARRQIFMVFAGFMMVERFGFHVHQVTALYLINLVANIMLAPLMGHAVARWGERKALLFEYFGLICVFLAYGGIYLFGWGVLLAAALYILDHMFFGLALALKTYFQKIADPADIAPTAAVAFTINHTSAVFLPVLLGFLWLTSPAAVFCVAAGLAALSFLLALLIPRHPQSGAETLLRPATTAATD